MAGLGSSPTWVTCGTSQALLAGGSGGYPRVLPFSSHLLIGSSRHGLDMSEVILKGALND